MKRVVQRDGEGETMRLVLWSTTMTYRIVLALAVLVFGSQLAIAHTPLASSVPANNAALTAPPANIVLKFPHAVQLTAVAVESADGKQKHTVSPLPDGKVKEATLVAPKLNAGAYVISWRAAGEDGHVMSGKIKFSIAAQ